VTRLPDDLLELPADRAARLVLRGLLDRARAARRRIEDSADVKALHDFRVALRRVRSWVRAYRSLLGKAVPKRIRSALRELAQATNVGRDAEVQLGWLHKHANDVTSEQVGGVAWLTGRLEERRDQAYATVREVGRSFDRLERALRARLRRRVAPSAERFGPVTAALLEARAGELKQRLTQIGSAADEAQIHSARIRGKRLRYLIEPLLGYREQVAPLLQRLRRLQDVLGDLHDLHIMTAELARDHAPASARGGLAPLSTRASHEETEHFSVLRSDWLDGGREFYGDVEALARSLLPTGHAAREIEHKFLLSALPADLRDGPVVEIRQGWLPGETLRERVRAIAGPEGEHYYRCVKVGSGLERIELEEEASKELFDSLWPLTEGKRLTKRRYPRTVGSLTWEVDEFTDRELVLAEVEVPFVRKRIRFPPWLKPHVIREVTGEPEYVNVNLAR
jgi:CHAD domain-containing protein/CYTH domain-containing protein